MNRNRQEKGITLIALVITIVILIILAGVAINLSIGENGIFKKAQEARKQTEIAEIKEEIQTQILAKQAENEGNISDETLNKILEKYGTINYEEDRTTIKSITTTKGNYEIAMSDIWKGNTTVEGGETDIIKNTESYIGYYADINGDGTVDGIIYADLAHDKSGKWNNDSSSNYEYTAQTNLKSYYIKEKNKSIKWGNSDTAETITADVIAPVNETTGNERFYVMALDDFKQGSYEQFYWYYDITGLDRVVVRDYNDFGQGKINTINMINDWNKNTAKYGEQTITGTYIDLWGAIQDNQYSLVQNANDTGKWFIPSKAEWSAYGDYLYTMLSITTKNYGKFGISDRYWSSSQGGTYNAIGANFYNGYIINTNAYNYGSVRLAATF